MQGVLAVARLSALVLSGFGFISLQISANDTDRSANGRIDILYEDDFSYADGGRVIKVNGSEPESEGDVHCLMYPFGGVMRPPTGSLNMIMVEDGDAVGPDGRPGVLRLEIAEIPPAARYWGFVVLGNDQRGMIDIPQWADGLKNGQLHRTFVSFRFRCENLRIPTEAALAVNFRFEPAVDGALPFAADFGTLFATTNWRTMKRPIGTARNLDAFVTKVTGENLQQFKLVWSQAGPTRLYQSGDTLLIDDIRITIE